MQSHTPAMLPGADATTARHDRKGETVNIGRFVTRGRRARIVGDWRLTHVR